MDDKKFAENDRAFMDALSGLREKENGGHGLAASVERRLRAGDAAPARRFPRLLPWLAPALALSLFLAVPALRGPAAPERVQLASRPASAAAVDEEIAILKEVGAWTDEDDRRVVPESEYEEIELSRAFPAVRTV